VMPGYYIDRLGGQPDPSEWKRQSREACANWQVFMKKQDADKPRFQYPTDSIFCIHAKNRGDASAGVQYLQIVEQELRRYGGDKRLISGTDYLIERLQAIPE